MCELLNTNSSYLKPVLPILLKDKTTGKNIIWATDSYMLYGPGYSERDYIEVKQITGLFARELLPRVEKQKFDQSARTRAKAEVFTPSWICNQMNNCCDNEWFGKKDVFNVEGEKCWTATSDTIVFPEGKTWQKYVDSRRLEITCGEAPFIVSRYDAASGEIIDIPSRIGILDRKMRVVGENTTTKTEWFEWATRAYQSVYGYEFQGDNLLIARINLLNTFVDYYTYVWKGMPDAEQLKKIAGIISWNFWQMDGLTETIPFATLPRYEEIQINFLDALEPVKTDVVYVDKCKTYDWRSRKPVTYGE